MGMQQDQPHNDLLKRELLKALHDEGLLESFLPVMYKNVPSPSLKALLLKLMDANKRHQELLDTAILSVTSHHQQSSTEEKSMISSFLNSFNQQTKEIQEQWGAHGVPTLQKVIHQQMANFEILHSLTQHAELQHLSEDFRHVVEESARICDELQKAWSTALASASN